MSEQEEYRIIELLKDYNLADKDRLRRLFDVLAKISAQHAKTLQGVVSQNTIDELVRLWNKDGV